MERKFSFDDMNFVAKAERVEGALQVGIYDAWDECLLSTEVPLAAAAPAAATTPAKPAKKRKGAPASAEDRAITDLIEQFKQKVEDGEIDLA
jgi:hypothetical protein